MSVGLVLGDEWNSGCGSGTRGVGLVLVWADGYAYILLYSWEVGN